MSPVLTSGPSLTALGEQLARDVETRCQQLAKHTADRIADHARALVPVKSGRTKRSIRVVEDLPHRAYHVDAGPNEALPAAPDWPANVPLWIEFGTVYIVARPFMRPAADREREPYRTDLERTLSALLEKASR